MFLTPKKVFGAKIFDNCENKAMNSPYPYDYTEVPKKKKKKSAEGELLR